MKVLTSLLENEGVQALITSNESEILEATEYFHSQPQNIKNYIAENLDKFVVPGDLAATFENMASFTANTVVGILSDIEQKLA